MGLDEVLSTGGLVLRSRGDGVVVIGVDAHKRTHTASVVEEATGRAQGDITVTADGDGHLRLLEFARRHDDERIWAVEDCRHVSGALERFLLGAGETVIRVPPNMMSRARATRGKSDSIDAAAVARAAIRQPDLPRAFLAGPEREIALLVGHRAHLVHERTRLSKRLRWLLHDLDPALEPADRTLSQLATIKRVDRRLQRRDPSIAVRICREHLARLRDLTRRTDALRRELSPMVRRHAPQLLLMPGCGTIVAARIVAESPTSTASKPTPSSRSMPASPRWTPPQANNTPPTQPHVSVPWFWSIQFEVDIKSVGCRPSRTRW